MLITEIPDLFCIFPCSSVVHLEIDNRKCSESSGECFANTDEVASFLAAAHIKADLPYPLVSVNSSELFIPYCKLKMQPVHEICA